MAEMMFGEQDAVGGEILVERAELFSQQAFLEQLLLEPQRQRHLKGTEAARRQRDIGFEQPLEFQEGLS